MTEADAQDMHALALGQGETDTVMRTVPVEPTFEQQDRALHDLGTPQPKESKQWLREYYRAMVLNASDAAPPLQCSTAPDGDAASLEELAAWVPKNQVPPEKEAGIAARVLAALQKATATPSAPPADARVDSGPTQEWWNKRCAWYSGECDRLNERIRELEAAPPAPDGDVVAALRELVEASREAYMSEPDDPEHDEDDEDVAGPGIGITFGMIRRARAALSRLEAQPASSGGEWQSISTAPRDGTHILIERPHAVFDEDRFHVVRWSDDWWLVHDGKNDHPLRGDPPTRWRLPDATPHASPADAAAKASSPTADAGLVEALKEIAAERRRQIEEEGKTHTLDDMQRDGQLTMAAACYAIMARQSDRSRAQIMQAQSRSHDGVPFLLKYWPWAEANWKPTDRRRDLIKAGALIVAEIERLDRAALARAGGQDNG